MNQENIARVIAEYKTNYRIQTKDAELMASVRGKFHTSEVFPKVGDYVVYTLTASDQATIESIQPRRNAIIRDVSDRSRNNQQTQTQVIAANVDIMFIVMGLDGDFNLRRLERYLVLAKESNTKPVIVLNKVDIAGDISQYRAEIETVAKDTPFHFVSALSGEGMNEIAAYFKSNTTAVLLGSSGAGKSTITNWLLGYDQQKVGEVREDDSRGRHTTTHRELFTLKTGGYLIDTPGIRSLGVIVTSDTDVFTDIEELILQCKYTDCDHIKSDGCAIKEAIQNGELDGDRFENYLKLQREKQFIEAKANKDLLQAKKEEVKKTHKDYKKIQNEKYKDRGFR